MGEKLIPLEKALVTAIRKGDINEVTRLSQMKDTRNYFNQLGAGFEVRIKEDGTDVWIENGLRKPTRGEKGNKIRRNFH